MSRLLPTMDSSSARLSQNGAYHHSREHETFGPPSSCGVFVVNTVKMINRSTDDQEEWKKKTNTMQENPLRGPGAHEAVPFSRRVQRILLNAK